jgi:putative intracellular protease/amidase
MLIFRGFAIGLISALSVVFAAEEADSVPHKWGVIIYPAFEYLDMFGPLEYLQMISIHYPNITLATIAQTLDPVSTKVPQDVIDRGFYPSIEQRIIPTHTFENAPDLDALLVPGGFGVENQLDANGDIFKFIQARYPVRPHPSLCV